MQRDPAAEKELAANHGQAAHVSASKPVGPQAKPLLVQGVYILQPDHSKQRATFVPITTGVTGATDIEVTGGITNGETLVTGMYKTLRTLKSGTVVKPDNSADSTASSSS